MPETTTTETIAPALLNDRQASAYLSLSPRKLWQLASIHDALRPVKVDGARCTRWRRSDLDKWIEGLAK